MTVRRVRWPVSALVLLMGVGTVSAQKEVGRELERTFAVPPGGELTIDLEAGGGVFVRGGPANQVTVHARLAGRDWEDTDVNIARVPGGVRVRAIQRPKASTSTAHAFAIQVPYRYSMRLESTGGGVTLRDLEGTFRGHTAGGGIDIEQVRGRVELTTGGGTVRVRDSELDGFVTTGGGAVTVVNTFGELRTASGSQPADRVGARKAPEVPGLNRGVIRIRRNGGSIDLAQAPDGADVSTGGGSIRIGSASGFVRAATGGGSIDVGPVTGSVVARTGNGAVNVSLDGIDGARPVVDIESGLGDVVLELPSNVSADVDIETAYTVTFGRATAVDSDWPLEREETPVWDSTKGTPRRYVRSRGRIGDGGPIVRVRTVNGDVTLRQRPR